MSHSPRHSLKTTRAKSALGIAAAAALGIAPLVAMTAVPAAAADYCTEYQNILPGGAEIIGNDGNVNVYAGRDLIVGSKASELEGVAVVSRDFDSQTSQYSIGAAGGGSRVAPSDGADVLTVGRKLSVNSGAIDVGAASRGDTAAQGVANVKVGGEIDNQDNVRVSGGGSVEKNVADVMEAYETWPQALKIISNFYSDLEVTGDVEIAGKLKFNGNNTSGREVFSIDASALSESWSNLEFTNIAEDATVIVNVVGDDAVTIDEGSFTLNDITNVNHQLELPDRVFANFTQRVLWNFVDTDDVTLTGASQLPGSILVPNEKSTLLVETSTNGRVYVGGTIKQGFTNSGLEFHNYPFVDGDTPVFGCSPEPKIVVPGSPTDDPTDEGSNDPDGDDESPSDPSDDPSEKPTDDPTTDSSDPTDPDGDESNDPDDNESGDPGDENETSDNGDSTGSDGSIDSDDDADSEESTESDDSDDSTASTDNGSVTIEETTSTNDSDTDSSATDSDSASTESASDDKELADTGSSLTWLPLGATALALMGAGLIAVTKRRARRS